MASIFGGKIKDFRKTVAKRPIKLCAERSYAAAFEIRINSINQNTTLKGKKMLFFCQHALYLSYRWQKSKKSCVFSFKIYSRILEKSQMAFGPSSEQFENSAKPTQLAPQAKFTLSGKSQRAEMIRPPSMNPTRQLGHSTSFQRDALTVSVSVMRESGKTPPERIFHSFVQRPLWSWKTRCTLDVKGNSHLFSLLSCGFCLVSTNFFIAALNSLFPSS